jgi:UDP-glucose:(heptosyl)LPS alpha-1,3-glucosyltransferase
VPLIIAGAEVIHMKKIAIDARTLMGCTGASAIVLEHAKFLVNHGCNVEIYSEKTDPELARSVGASSVIVKPFGFTDYQKRRSFAMRVQSDIEKKQHDLVIGNGGLLKQDVVFLHNLVHRAHELIPGESKKKLATAGRIHADFLSSGLFKLLVANSNMMKHDLMNRYRIPGNKIITVYPGNDLSRFSAEKRLATRSASRLELGIRQEEMLMGLITSGNFEKRGVAPLFEAVNLIPDEKVHSFRFLVVGKEKDFNSYLSLLKQTVRDRVIHIPQEKRIEKLYYALDLYVLPAYIEEFGLVIQEAMACGLPIITTKNVGASELLPPDQQRYILDYVEPSVLCERVLELADDAEKRDRLGAVNAAAAADNNWARYNEQIFSAYQSMGLL